MFFIIQLFQDQFKALLHDAINSFPFRIDHWDNEKERILILCDHTLLVVRFDFIAMCLKDYKRLALHVIDKLQVGDLVYPSKSLMP